MAPLNPLLPFLGGDQGNTLSTVLSMLMYMSFILFIFFGQKIQARMMLWEIAGTLKKIEFTRNEAKQQTLKTIREIGKPKDDPTPRLNSLMDQFMIQPVNLDPAGIVWKLDHLLNVRDFKFKKDVKAIAPEASDVQVNNLENLVEVSMVLNIIFKVVRHFYLLGKKTSSFYIILQLQMLLPLIMQEVEALVGAVKAFSEGHPIGDGIGALVALKLMGKGDRRKMEKDIVVAETTLDGRRILALKAEGPGANVGKPGDAIRRLIEENDGKIAMVIMVDAALKFEGENAGEVSEGIGAAIGGPGTERFKIEEEVLKFKIPVYAVIIKQSIQDAITGMKKEICDAAETAITRIKSLISEHTSEGDSVIVAGIGNTVGIGQ